MNINQLGFEEAARRLQEAVRREEEDARREKEDARREALVEAEWAAPEECVSPHTITVEAARRVEEDARRVEEDARRAEEDAGIAEMDEAEEAARAQEEDEEMGKFGEHTRPGAFFSWGPGYYATIAFITESNAFASSIAIKDIPMPGAWPED